MRWKPLVLLGTAQFLAVPDTSVMNVSISQLVEDFDTDVTAIQAVITVYTLVMAAFMITGGKIGDRIGRRRAFGLGLMIYAVGSLLTAVAPTLLVLTLGWSIIEGLGAASSCPPSPRWSVATTQARTARSHTGSSAGSPVPASPSVRCWVAG
jgi:MFS family permease